MFAITLAFEKPSELLRFYVKNNEEGLRLAGLMMLTVSHTPDEILRDAFVYNGDFARIQDRLAAGNRPRSMTFYKPSEEAKSFEELYEKINTGRPIAGTAVHRETKQRVTLEDAIERAGGTVESRSTENTRRAD